MLDLLPCVGPSSPVSDSTHTPWFCLSMFIIWYLAHCYICPLQGQIKVLHSVAQEECMWTNGPMSAATGFLTSHPELLPNLWCCLPRHRILPPEKCVCRSRIRELDMEQQTGYKLGKEYIKAVYCHPAYLTYMQSTSWEMPGWMKHKLEPRLLGEISTTSDDTTLTA